MTPADMAALHGLCFSGTARWPAEAFARTLEGRGIFVVEAAGGFALGRAVADEAELLTFAVHPDRRRLGIGRDLLERFEAAARDRGAVSAYLEVAADNDAARALYAGAGWDVAGRRAGYYGAGDALILRKAL
ncbi:GNAT family N-acetyltransferase [Jannaschia rubra]|uniref:GNAT family N-acetyltransferase n=1 Tax=Jannaschia rubra TaxID=282197 RepID=UPI0024904A7F|nr:GNAT family N-acetyltransferase [Jannaschia rubra]